MDHMEIKKEISKYVDTRLEDLWELSDYIYHHPEVGFKEYDTSKKLMDVLTDEGFCVEGKSGGLDTAFVASFSIGKVKKPRIDILCEYDLGEAMPTETRVAHACGHKGCACLWT